MKHKKLIIVGIIVVAVVLIISALSNSTYALFSSDDYGANPNVYSTGSLSIEAKSKSDVLSLNNVLPMSDERGKESIPYIFTIKNTGTVNYKFNVKLLSTGNSGTSFSSNYIKLQIDDGDVTTLSSLTSSMIKNDIVLAAGETVDISIRLWLDEETPNSEIGKSFNSKIVIDGQGVFTEDKETLADYITNLYLDNKDAELVVNNTMSYRYASIYDKDDSDDTSGGLMNDRLGTMDIGEDNGNIRYYGANPNNFIYFNCSNYANQTESTCEKWRIIGVFDDKVKIMRNGSIGTLAWDQDKNDGDGKTTYNNDWSNSSLQALLNGKYYDRGTTTSVTYYSGSAGGTAKTINLVNVGIKNDKTRGLISDTLWYLRGWDNGTFYAHQMYDYERVSGNLYITTQPKTLSSKIAILYASDYGYAVDFNSCKSALTSYDNTACVGTSWIRKIFVSSSTWWLLSPSGNDSKDAGVIVTSGEVDYADNPVYATNRGVVPVLHLNSNLSINAGDGTEGNPYRLAVN